MMAVSQGGSPGTSSGESPRSVDLIDAGKGWAFWEYLAPAVRSALSEVAQLRVFGRGGVLICHGEVLIVRVGWAKVTAPAYAGGGEAMLRLHGPGDLVGEEIVLTGRSPRTTVVAITDVQALAVPVAEFMSVATAYPALTRALYRVQDDRLDDAEQHIIAATADGPVQIARLLLALCDRYGMRGPHGITIPVPLSQADLAAWAATSRKTVVRALSQMRDNGLIATGYRTLTITSPARLRTYLTETLGPTRRLIYRLLLAVDVEKHSAWEAREQLRSQMGLRNILSIAAQNVGLDRNQWYEQVSGDGELAVLPESADVSLVVGDFTRQLQLALAEFNQRHTDSARLRIRLAMHHATLTPGPHGPAGDAPTVVSRLLNAKPLRRVLTDHPDRDVALIVSSSLYQDVIRTGFCGLDPDEFEAVRVIAKGIPYHGFIQRTPSRPLGSAATRDASDAGAGVLPIGRPTPSTLRIPHPAT